MKISVEELCGIQHQAAREAVRPWKEMLAELRAAASVVVNYQKIQDHPAVWGALNDAISHAAVMDKENP